MHSSIETHFGCFSFLSTLNKAATKVMCKVAGGGGLCEYKISQSGKYLGIQLQDCVLMPGLAL